MQFFVTIVDVFQKLGINQTFFFYLVLMIVVIALLTTLVFKPFSEALELRLKNTASLEDIEVETKTETAQLKQKFELRAREINGKIKTIFDESKNLGQKEVTRIVSEARQKADAFLDIQKKNLASELSQAESDIQKEVQQVSQAINSKVTGSTL